MALGSSRPAGMMFRPQPATVKAKPAGAQIRKVPNGVADEHAWRNRPARWSRGIQDRADRNSAAQSISTGRRRAWPAMRSWKLVYPLARSASRRNRPSQNRALHAAQAFIVAEEEDLVAAIENLRDDYRTAGGKAELVLTKFALGDAASVFEKVGGVELVVAEEFPRRRRGSCWCPT